MGPKGAPVLTLVAPKRLQRRSERVKIIGFLGCPPKGQDFCWRTSSIWFWDDFSIWPKTKTNQQQSKSEAKAIPREAKVQEWFAESVPGEGLPDLKGFVFYQLFQLGRFGFSLRSKAEDVGKKASQIDEMEAKSIQNDAQGTH